MFVRGVRRYLDHHAPLSQQHLSARAGHLAMSGDATATSASSPSRSARSRRSISCSSANNRIASSRLRPADCGGSIAMLRRRFSISERSIQRTYVRRRPCASARAGSASDDDKHPGSEYLADVGSPTAGRILTVTGGPPASEHRARTCGQPRPSAPPVSSARKWLDYAMADPDLADIWGCTSGREAVQDPPGARQVGGSSPWTLKGPRSAPSKPAGRDSDPVHAAQRMVTIPPSAGEGRQGSEGGGGG